MFSPTMLLSGLDARDRRLFRRWALADCSRTTRILWTVVTHLGGATCCIAAAVVPLFMGDALAHTATRALATLVLSHLLVQMLKRSVVRPRPSHTVYGTPLVIEPDRFSFPSGHAAAAMSVAFVYASGWPALALPLIALAGAVGLSRVFLGVHYLGDVLSGQLIAVATGAVVLHALR